LAVAQTCIGARREYFDFCCAYTGKPVTKATAVMDHAIPMNKRHCGLHLFGNLVPCISAANAEKHYRHYREFLSSPERVQRVDEWLRRIQYFRRVEAIANLPAVCSEKYALILQQCRAGREFAFQQFGTAINREPTAVRRPRLARVRPNVLPIELVSIADGDFKEELLRTRRAWITVEYRGGEVDCTVWRIDRLTPESNILRNLRSRPRFRALVGLWALCITNQTQILHNAWQF